MDIEIRVSTESQPWRTNFSHRSSRDSNLWPFSQESSTLTTELSLPPTECIKLFCQVLIYYCINYFCLILYDTVSGSDDSCGPKWHLKCPRHFQLCVFSLCLDEIRPRWWMKFPRCDQNSPKSHTSEKECFLSYSWNHTCSCVFTSLRLVEGVYKPQRACVGWASETESCLEVCM